MQRLSIEIGEGINGKIPVTVTDHEGEYVPYEDAMKRIKEYRAECSRLSHEVGFEKRRANNKDAHIKELTEMLRKVNKYYGIPPHSDKAYEIQHEIQALLKGE